MGTKNVNRGLDCAAIAVICNGVAFALLHYELTIDNFYMHMLFYCVVWGTICCTYGLLAYVYTRSMTAVSTEWRTGVFLLVLTMILAAVVAAIVGVFHFNISAYTEQLDNSIMKHYSDKFVAVGLGLSCLALYLINFKAKLKS